MSMCVAGQEFRVRRGDSKTKFLPPNSVLREETVPCDFQEDRSLFST